ncbi:MAG TPA: DUF1566 domain-containing protein [Desulfobacterales bacterium]|nr:DUF1566 domain-containing protein [Desulfobacterales bacterium]HIP39065.1 DUF1566 domain-containing protein [Desulfocapsa sulfexigens]
MHTFRIQKVWQIVLLITILVLPVSIKAANWHPLSDTGHVACYDIKGFESDCPEVGQRLYGQDAQYQGTAAAYRDNGNQTISDLRSGLMWSNFSDNIQRTWKGAISYCDELIFADETDWRLPSKFELESIVDYGRSYPAMNQVFSCESSFYWSATPHVGNKRYAWSVYCEDGADHWVHKSNNYYVRCVRSGR